MCNKLPVTVYDMLNIDILKGSIIVLLKICNNNNNNNDSIIHERIVRREE